MITCLLDAISSCPSALQAEIIPTLPELTTDSCQKIVVTYLLGLLTEEPLLMTVILDSLVGFNLEEGHLCEARDAILDQLTTIELETLVFMIHRSP